MQKYQDTVTDRSGNAINGASVLVKTIGGAVAVIYSDNALTEKTNPLTTDQNGAFSFYAEDGRYSLTISGNHIVSKTVSDISLQDDREELTYLAAEPTPAAGMVVLADGVAWDPGSGAGMYRRNQENSAWVFVG